MPIFSDVQQFVREANRVERLPDLKSLLGDMVESLGFDHVALVHHVNLSGPLSQAVEIVDYPAAWKAQILTRGYFSHDPVLAACQKSAAAFRWSEVDRLIDLTSRQREILESAGSCGLGDGFTVPVNVPGEFLGSCSFGARAGIELPERSLPAAQYVGCFAFEAARRIRRSESARPDTPPPKLTSRQFDCLVLAAQGKSDWDIGQLLGISKETVHHHIEQAKRKYGVSSRTQLVVRALFDSQITFGDVVH